MNKPLRTLVRMLMSLRLVSPPAPAPAASPDPGEAPVSIPRTTGKVRVNDVELYFDGPRHR